jgi:hypothetical protein
LDAPLQSYLKWCRSLAAKVKHPRFYAHRLARVGLRKSLGKRLLKYRPRFILARFPATELSIAHHLIETAAVAYEPVKYEGSVLLLLATERDPAFDFLSGWKQLVPDSLCSVYVDGRHREVITPRNVRDIATIIHTYLTPAGRPS